MYIQSRSTNGDDIYTYIYIHTYIHTNMLNSIVSVTYNHSQYYLGNHWFIAMIINSVHVSLNPEPRLLFQHVMITTMYDSNLIKPHNLNNLKSTNTS
jgi:hypothetical protein